MPLALAAAAACWLFARCCPLDAAPPRATPRSRARTYAPIHARDHPLSATFATAASLPPPPCNLPYLAVSAASAVRAAASAPRYATIAYFPPPASPLFHRRPFHRRPFPIRLFRLHCSFRHPFYRRPPPIAPTPVSPPRRFTAAHFTADRFAAARFTAYRFTADRFRPTASVPPPSVSPPPPVSPLSVSSPPIPPPSVSHPRVLLRCSFRLPFYRCPPPFPPPTVSPPRRFTATRSSADRYTAACFTAYRFTADRFRPTTSVPPPSVSPPPPVSPLSVSPPSVGMGDEGHLRRAFRAAGPSGGQRMGQCLPRGRPAFGPARVATPLRASGGARRRTLAHAPSLLSARATSARRGAKPCALGYRKAFGPLTCTSIAHTRNPKGPRGRTGVPV